MVDVKIIEMDSQVSVSDQMTDGAEKSVCVYHFTASRDETGASIEVWTMDADFFDTHWQPSRPVAVQKGGVTDQRSTGGR